MHDLVAVSERLTLSRWSDDDADDLAGIGTGEVLRYLGGDAWTPQTTRDSTNLWRQIEQRLGVSTWAVRLRDADDTLIGSCGFAGTNAPWLRFDAVIEIGWTLGWPWWHHGYATEAAAAALQVALGRFPAKRILSKCHPENAASEAVMQRIGMERIGVVRGNRTAPTLLYRF